MLAKGKPRSHRITFRTQDYSFPRTVISAKQVMTGVQESIVAVFRNQRRFVNLQNSEHRQDTMSAPLDSGSESEIGRFVTEADWIPGFWNYLLDLDREDLIAELIQNDLDQDATRTVISFKRDHLICEGNGRPIEDDGWKRLRKIQGAGDSVPAKRGKIGVKNHGLKTAFTIGDEIRVMSAGQAIVQTLYAKGRQNPPYPGASPTPEDDPQAPQSGCRIIIRFRDAVIKPPHGEATVIMAVSSDDVDSLFRTACASIPEQFAGIVSPDVMSRYEIVLRHWQLGEARFVFSCKRPHKIPKRIELFRRECLVTGTVPDLPPGLREQAARRLMPLGGHLKKRIADFFRRGNRFFIEVSWPVDGRGKPKTGIGRFRYPIGYPASSHEARTGHGACFNAPVASDSRRHGPARNESTYSELREACENLLVDVLAQHAIRKWEPAGLTPLVPSPGTDNRDEAVRPLLAELAGRGAMPTVAWSKATMPLGSKKRNAKVGFPRLPRPRGASEKRRYRFIIPIPSWTPDKFNPALSILSPRSELQLHPRTHTEIVALLTDQKTNGFGETFVTFDENDAFRRVTDGGNEWFDAPSEPETEFTSPLVARAYLDLIQSALKHDSCDGDIEVKLQDALFLPEANGQPRPFRELRSSAALPSNVPGLTLPPILHPGLADHPLFRHRKWHRPRYTMEDFLEEGTLQSSDEETRTRFWNWLSRNERYIKPGERSKLADIPIWPDDESRLCPISDLCDPRSARMANMLRDFIRQPHEQVRRSRLVSFGGRGRTAIRLQPNDQEVVGWLNDRLAHFPPGIEPDTQTVSALTRFETDLATLLEDKTIARVIKGTDANLPALAKDGSIQERAMLVIPSRANERLALPSRFLLGSNHRASALDKLSPALDAPTSEMLLDSFAEDGTNFAALQVRLRRFVTVTEPGDNNRDRLSCLPIIPVHGSPQAPLKLTFIGRKGDYWGEWKVRLSSRGLSQDDQRRYLEVGVISARPKQETSRDFLLWLSKQDENVLWNHIPCVLRHILHPDGPAYWADSFTNVPFLPVRGQNGYQLISLQDALRGPVYLPDAGNIAEEVIKRDPKVLIVIDHVKEVPESVSEPLRKHGVKSLREALKEPSSVSGDGTVVPADEQLHERISALQSKHFRRTFLKRLAELGVETVFLRTDWRDRLSRIREVRFADKVVARYRFRSRIYPVSADSGLDPELGIFWIKRVANVEISNLYEVIAAQCVFKPSARPVDCLALERALELEIRDPSYGRFRDVGPVAEGEDHAAGAEEVDTEDEANDEDDSGPSELGEAAFGHSPFDPDLSRNIPQPKPFSSSAVASRSHRRGDKRSTGSEASAGRPAPEMEKRHIEELKRSHYASHCQMCLCEHAPQVLAPRGSYIHWEEVRRRIIEAHHVDLKSAGGARHAGNLILLCTRHHNNYGRRLTRTAVTDALQERAVNRVIRFGAAGKELKGCEIELTIPDTREVIKIFFTTEHAAFWLSQFAPSPEATDIPVRQAAGKRDGPC